MGFFSNLFGKSKKNLPENLSPSSPPDKLSPEANRGGTTLRKKEDASPQPQKKPGPALTALEMAERQSWEVKTLPVWDKGDEILGLYRVEDVIETGGMGRVYIAHHKGWNVKLAIKAPNEMMLSDRNNFARVLREANSWTELGLHPNIAYCYYVRSIEDVPHIFVEYVDGGNLEQWIADGKCIDYRVSLDLAIQFCHGMEHAHSKGMIHRDIKPKNILMTKDGMLKITDFGLVRIGPAIGGEKGKAGVSGKGMTRLGDVMGTEGFMAPEQFTHAAGVDERADIFSFGVCLYEMCCGAKPYDITIGERKDAPDPIQISRDTKFPEALADVLKRCVQWERDKRYASFNEIRERLTTIYRDLYGQESPYAELELVDLEADGLNNRGVSYFELGRKKEALSCWEQALQLNPMHPEVTYNQGLILWRDARIADDEVLRRLENCRNNPGADKEKLAELKSFILAERQDINGDRDVLKGFTGRFDALFSGEDIEQEKSVRILEGHTKSVKSVAVTPNGQYAVSGSWDKTLRVWELLTSRCVRTLEGHTGLVNSVAVTPDGRYAVSGSDDKTLRMWELETGRCVSTMKEYSIVKCLALTPDGRHAVSGNIGCTLWLWELVKGQWVRTMEGHTGCVNSVAITPNGEYAVSGSYDTTLRVWDISRGRCVRTMKGHTGCVESVAITPNGEYAVSGSYDTTLRVWELSMGRCVRTLVGHIGWVESIAITADGRYVVSGSTDKTLRVWELASGQCVRTLEGHTDWVKSVVLIPDEQYAVSGSQDKTLRVWKIFTDIAYRADIQVSVSRGFKEIKKEKDSLDEAIKNIRNLYEKRDYRRSFSVLYENWKRNEFSENELIIELYSKLLKKGRIKSLDFSFQKKLLTGHTGEPSSVAITPDGRYAVSGSLDKSLRVWELSSGRCVRTMKGHTGQICSVGITADGRYAVSAADSDKALRVWELSSGRCVRTMKGHTDGVSSVALISDGWYAVSGSYDNTLRVWELASGRCIRTMKGSTGAVTSVAVTPDGRHAVSSNWDDTLRVWELGSGRCVRIMEGHTALVQSVVITPDSRYAMSCSFDKTLRVWELASGRSIGTFGESLYPVAFCPGQRYALSGSADNALRVWEITTGRCVHTMLGHSSYVTALSLTFDGQYAVSGSNDKTLRVWELIWDLEFPDPVDWDEGVRPYLEIFLTLRKGKWGEEDFKLLIDELASKRGYGWVRPGGVRRELEKMTKKYGN